MFLLLVLLPKFLISQEVCYPTVVRHRIDSIFPTNRLLCIAKQNDNIEYSNVPIVQSVEDWKQYSLSRGIEPANKYQNVTLIMLEDKINAFKIPATLSDGDFCSGTQNIEFNRNSTTKCRPKITSLENCATDKFLNSRLLFGNSKLAENIAFEASLFDPISNATGCYGVMRMVTMNFVKNGNGTALSRASVDIVYDSINLQNIREFEQTFVVNFIVGNTTVSFKGYRTGDIIYSVNGMVAVPLSIPILGPCYSSTNMSPILYTQTISGLCSLDKTTSCDDAKLQARRFYDQVYPLEVLSAPTDDAQPALVNRINVTWDEKSPSQTTCRLPVASLFQIYTSRQGSVKNYREIVIGASFQLSLNYIDYSPGQTIFLPLSVKFTDVTPKPKSVFASLPYIDIRLPNDFFYPFIRNSAQSHRIFRIFTIFLMLYKTI